LVLALIFMVISAMIVTALAAWSSNDIQNAGNLKSTRLAVYAADSAIQIAIWNIRYSYPTTVTAEMCPNGSGTSTAPFTFVDNPKHVVLQRSVYVWCGATVISPTASQGWTRQVTMYAYLSNSPACNVTGPPTTWSCDTSSRPVVQAVVDFNDFDPSGNNTCLPSRSGSTCGFGMNIASWVIQPGAT
jgi:hypothetical protein